MPACLEPRIEILPKAQREIWPLPVMRLLALFAALWLGLVLPAQAADDVAAAQGVIRSQVEAFSRDDAAAAYSYAAPAIQGLFPRADIFLGMVQRSYAPGLPPQELRVRRGPRVGRQDRAARSHHRRQWRAMGGAVYAASTSPTAA